MKLATKWKRLQTGHASQRSFGRSHAVSMVSWQEKKYQGVIANQKSWNLCLGFLRLQGSTLLCKMLLRQHVRYWKTYMSCVENTEETHVAKSLAQDQVMEPRILPFLLSRMARTHGRCLFAACWLQPSCSSTRIHLPPLWPSPKLPLVLSQRNTKPCNYVEIRVLKWHSGANVKRTMNIEIHWLWGTFWALNEMPKVSKFQWNRVESIKN